MKKLFIILFVALLFGVDAWAGTPVAPSQLQAGHYYRIRGRSNNYMCWAGQESSSSSSHAAMMPQPVIFINAEKARTEPGTIWLLSGSGPNDWEFTAQGQGFRSGMNGKYIGFEKQRQQSGITVNGLAVQTSSQLDFQEPSNNTDNRVYFYTYGRGNGIAYLATKECYLQPTGTSTNDGYLGVTSAAGNGAAFYFEEVDGIDNYLGFPPADRSYAISGNLLNTSGEVYSSYSGSGTYQISDVQVGQDGDGTTWYYATMCLPFPVEVPSNMQCFFVNSSNQTIAIDYNESNHEKNPRTGKIIAYHYVIPAGTPFVARSQSNNPTDNRLVPYIISSSPAAPTNNSENKLVAAKTTSGGWSSTTTPSYLVKTANNNTLYNSGNNKIRRLSSVGGNVEFDTQITSSSELTDGNRAYYGQQSEPIVYEPEEAELADLIYEDNGTKWTDKDYVKITDDLLICYINEKEGFLFARDMENNKGYWSKVTTTPDNYYNFRPEGTELLEPADYNQSNWVIIQVPVNQVKNFSVGMTIPGGKLKGSIQSEKSLPIFNMVAIEGQAGQSNLELNTYSVAHLMAGDDHLVQSGKNGQDYFFMTPKPVEVAHVTWAVLKKSGDNVYAYIPKSSADGTVNGLDFHGRVLLSPGLYSGSTNDWTDENLQALDGQMFNFLAAITKENGNSYVSYAPRRAESIDVNEDDPISANHVIYPLEITQTQVITAVEGVNVTKTVKSVKFYNLQGMASDTPLPGVNIVVELFDDGTTRSSKMVF